MSTCGVLPPQEIRRLVERGLLRGVDRGNIRQATVDLTITNEAYRVAGLFRPQQGQSVRAALQATGAEPCSLDDPFIPPQVYLIRLGERYDLPVGMNLRTNPRSSTGRLFIRTRIIADGIDGFGYVSGAFVGGLWVLVQPTVFAIQLTVGDALTQCRFSEGDAGLTTDEFYRAIDRDHILWQRGGVKPLGTNELHFNEDGARIYLSVDLASDVAGWEAVASDHVITFSRMRRYRRSDFFKPLALPHRRIILRQGRRYIFRTREWVRLPPWYFGTHPEYHPELGEFISNYAGFVMPGWGWGASGEGVGRPITLEVTAFEDFLIEDGQLLASLSLERLTDPSDAHYDATETSSYTTLTAAPPLSKHFTSE